MIRILPWAVALAIVLTAKPAAAQSRLLDLSLEDLARIEVLSVSKEPEEVRRTPAAVHVITQDDIRRSGATSVPEVLRLAPGVVVARIDTDHWSVGVRGLGDQFSKSLLILIDGRNVYTPLFAGIYWAAHDIMLDDVERIEVVRGPGGTIWGSNAVSGVINIITKGAASTQGTLVSLTTGNSDRAVGSVRYGGHSAGGFNYRVYGRAFDRGPQFHPDGSGYDTWKMGQAGFRADWSRGDADKLSLHGDVSIGRHGQRVNITALNPPSVSAVDDPVDASGGNVVFTWDRAISASQGLQVHAYYDRTSWLASHFSETRDTMDVDVVHRLKIPRQQVIWGAGARWSPGRFRPTIPSLTFVPEGRTDTIYSTFVQDDLDIVRDRLAVTVGSKFERNTYTGFELQPSARLLWTPGPSTSFWAAATRAIRTPSRIEEDFRGLSVVSAPQRIFLQVTGNPDLEAERLLGYEAGFRQLVGANLHVDVAAFRHEHEGLMSFRRGDTRVDTSVTPGRIVVEFPYVNGISGHSRGVELAPDWQPAGWLRFRAAYSYLRFDLATAEFVADRNADAAVERSSPRHQFRLQTMIALPGRFDADVTYRSATDVPARRVASYDTADARLGWRVRPGLELSISGHNLLQPHHVEYAATTGIVRSVQAGATWHLTTGP